VVDVPVGVLVGPPHRDVRDEAGHAAHPLRPPTPVSGPGHAAAATPPTGSRGPAARPSGSGPAPVGPATGATRSPPPTDRARRRPASPAPLRAARPASPRAASRTGRRAMPAGP